MPDPVALLQPCCGKTQQSKRLLSILIVQCRISGNLLGSLFICIPTVTPPLLHTTALWPTSTPLQQLPPTPINRPSIPPAPFPQKPPNAPRVHPTSPRVASPIAQPTSKFTLAASPRVEAPTSIAHRTCSRNTADPMFPLATPLSHTPVSSHTRYH